MKPGTIHLWAPRPNGGSALRRSPHRPHPAGAAQRPATPPPREGVRRGSASAVRGHVAGLPRCHRRLRRPRPATWQDEADPGDRHDPLRCSRGSRRTRPTRTHAAPTQGRCAGLLRLPGLELTHRGDQRPTRSAAPARPRIPQPDPLPDPVTAALRQPHPRDRCTLKPEAAKQDGRKHRYRGARTLPAT